MSAEQILDRSNSQTEDWQYRLGVIVEMMREMSVQVDPQAMVRAYGAKIRQILPADRSVSLSRRNLKRPEFRVTRCSLWKDPINPWKEPERLPLLKGGLFADLIYGDQPRIIDEIRLAEDDPAAEYLSGQRSLLAIPNYDQGVALNMVVIGREAPSAFPREELPELVWMSNLFGRATQNLVLSEKLQTAYEAVDRELTLVADIQRSLLPADLPRIPTLDLSVRYQTSRRAGGDYYDFFPLPDGRWGILIADVSGHGTPAAVVMAITHSIAHGFPGHPTPPTKVLGFVNERLTRLYTNNGQAFVTAFYGVYDPAARRLTYARAGHCPPRLKRCADGSIFSLDRAGGLPLGISAGETYEEATCDVRRGDQIVFYTDGITEAFNPAGEMFGLRGLDGVIRQCRDNSTDLIHAILAGLADFTAGAPVDDDRTILVGKVL